MKSLLLKFKSAKYLHGSFLLRSSKIVTGYFKSSLLHPAYQIAKINSRCSIPCNFWNNYFGSITTNSFVGNDMLQIVVLCKRVRIPTIIKTEFRIITNKFTNIRIYAL